MTRVARLAIASLLSTCGGIAVIDDATSSASSSTSTGSSTSSGTTGPATATASSGGGGCVPGLDEPCDECASNTCLTELQFCTDLSACDAQGQPVAGCLALIACAFANCAPSIDPICIVQFCEDELQSAGGPTGEGTMAAQNLGGCLQAGCAARCGF